jgi:hypothetical protein
MGESTHFCRETNPWIPAIMLPEWPLKKHAKASTPSAKHVYMKRRTSASCRNETHCNGRCLIKYEKVYSLSRTCRGHAHVCAAFQFEGGGRLVLVAPPPSSSPSSLVGFGDRCRHWPASGLASCDGHFSAPGHICPWCSPRRSHGRASPRPAPCGWNPRAVPAPYPAR